MAAETQIGEQLKQEEISATISRERGRLLSFISNRTPTIEDAEDILQDVFYELVQNEQIENTAAWLYRVARNKITDWYRKMKPSRLDDISSGYSEDDEPLLLADILPSVEASPEKQLLIKLIWETLTDALSELPAEQRDVFVQHELDGLSLKDIAASTGCGIKTVISRKRYAVQHLRIRLRRLYDELLNN